MARMSRPGSSSFPTVATRSEAAPASRRWCPALEGRRTALSLPGTRRAPARRCRQQPEI